MLANIYLGKIKKWNDAGSRRSTRASTFRIEDITPIYRTDGSGTTYNFTDYLSNVSPEWKTKVGKGTQPNFPTGIGGRGSSGVAGRARSTERRDHLRRRRVLAEEPLQVRDVKNSAGKYQLPGIRQIAGAADRSIKLACRAATRISIVDPPEAQPKAYPISTFTYVIVPAEDEQGRRR